MGLTNVLRRKDAERLFHNFYLLYLMVGLVMALTVGLGKDKESKRKK
jgi:hypothetical protein